MLHFYMKLSFLRFYLTERKRDQKAQAGGMAEGEGKAGFPLSREPDGPWDPGIIT